MSKRCESEVAKALAAQRDEFSKRCCVMCKHGVPLYGKYHVIDEITDEKMHGPAIVPVKMGAPLVFKCVMIA